MAKKIETLYIAGSLTPRGVKSNNPAIEYLYNIRDMIKCGLEVFQAGFDPFIPALDFQMFLQLGDGERITEPQIKRYSKTWLKRCDAIFLMPGWRKSTGTLAEMELAKELHIPIFESIEDLKKITEE